MAALPTGYSSAMLARLTGSTTELTGANSGSVQNVVWFSDAADVIGLAIPGTGTPYKDTLAYVGGGASVVMDGPAGVPTRGYLAGHNPLKVDARYWQCNAQAVAGFDPTAQYITGWMGIYGRDVDDGVNMVSVAGRDQGAVWLRDSSDSTVDAGVVLGQRLTSPYDSVLAFGRIGTGAFSGQSYPSPENYYDAYGSPSNGGQEETVGNPRRRLAFFVWRYYRPTSLADMRCIDWGLTVRNLGAFSLFTNGAYQDVTTGAKLTVGAVRNGISQLVGIDANQRLGISGLCYSTGGFVPDADVLDLATDFYTGVTLFGDASPTGGGSGTSFRKGTLCDTNFRKGASC